MSTDLTRSVRGGAPQRPAAGRGRRRRRRGLTGLLVLSVLVGGGLWFARALRPLAAPPLCTATAGGASYSLTPDEAAHAATIAAVGASLGLPDHAVTIALAAALQESGLDNLPYGDRDSLGLFQQRPSEGWGTPAQILDPRHAAAAFYSHLAKVPGWQTMSVAAAAQSVQHSAAGSAYADWTTDARVLAEALTGEEPTGLACSWAHPVPAPPASSLAAAAAAELGPAAFGVPLPAKRGWQVATWAVAHAHGYRLSAVAFDGWRWTPRASHWVADRAAGPAVTVLSG